jgi:hypothetical protein
MKKKRNPHCTTCTIHVSSDEAMRQFNIAAEIMCSVWNIKAAYATGRARKRLDCYPICAQIDENR